MGISSSGRAIIENAALHCTEGDQVRPPKPDLKANQQFLHVQQHSSVLESTIADRRESTMTRQLKLGCLSEAILTGSS